MSDKPLSFWGGYDSLTGEIIDRRHPLSGEFAAGKILALPFSRGSSTTTAVLLESMRGGTAPAAILTIGVDTFYALASIVAEELFNETIPILSLSPADFERLKNGDTAKISQSGEITISTQAEKEPAAR
ncbi:MAG: aconitase X swivel domain-containing protein [Anaerolineales bacterium]